MARRITIFNQDSGYLMIDLANAYLEAGWQVRLVTGRLVVREKALKEGIRVVRVARYRRGSLLQRLVTWSVAALQMLVVAWTRCRGDHLILVSNPPLTTLLPILLDNHCTLLIYDVYPDAISEMGVLEPGSWIISVWRKACKIAFKKARRIITITESMRVLLQGYVVSKRVEVVPIWSDTGSLRPIAKEVNPFITQHKFAGKLVVMYSGNLGRAQGVDVLIEVARRVPDPRVQFVVVGDGERKAHIRELTRRFQLKNFLVLPYQPASVFPYSLAAADIGVVTQSQRGARVSVPSKAFSLMAAGVALLGIAAPGSELAGMIGRHLNGQCFTEDQVDEMASFVVRLAEREHELLLYKERSVAAAEEYGFESIARIISQPDV
jgi:glycosyltransferase involved in cell wall biosynthesis